MAHNVRPAWRVTGFSTTYCYRVRTNRGWVAIHPLVHRLRHHPGGLPLTGGLPLPDEMTTQFTDTRALLSDLRSRLDEARRFL